ncbi:hypothetical protein Lal_00047967 [Lupinus albus]|nr:hypothetical protein Lal_00047967 [Lupinus albus]
MSSKEQPISSTKKLSIFIIFFSAINIYWGYFLKAKRQISLDQPHLWRASNFAFHIALSIFANLEEVPEVNGLKKIKALYGSREPNWIWVRLR